MTDTYEIAVLAEDYARKKRHFELLGLQNAYGSDPDEQLKRDVAYEVARAEMEKARFDLQTAQMKFATGKP